MRAVLTVVALAVGCSAAGCSTAVTGNAVPAELRDRDVIAAYFAALAESAAQGAAAQTDFLRETQHPDYMDRLCDLRGATVQADPVMSTLRPDPRWAPESGRPPRGTTYVVAVSLRVSKDGKVLGEQVGSERIVVLDGIVRGFMPCFQDG